MKLAIEKAKKNGVGIVSVRNSNHYGIAGYYAKMAAKEGMLGFSSTNSEAIMVAHLCEKSHDRFKASSLVFASRSI